MRSTIGRSPTAITVSAGGRAEGPHVVLVFDRDAAGARPPERFLRDAEFRLAQAEQACGILHGARARLHEHGVVQRHQPEEISLGRINLMRRKERMT